MCLQDSYHETHGDQDINMWELSYPIQNNLHPCHVHVFALFRESKKSTGKERKMKIYLNAIH